MNKTLSDRMKKVLTNDRLQCRENLQSLLKSEAFDMLSDFFELDNDKISVKIDTASDGYVITVKAKAIRVY